MMNMLEFADMHQESQLSLAEQAARNNYPSTATGSFVADLVSRLHARSPEDAMNWVCKYETYVLEQVPLSNLHIIHSSSEQARIDKYAEMETYPPPIVIDRDSGSAWIIDGYHRARASELRGKTHILAYVGDVINEDWFGEPGEENDGCD